MIEDSQQLQDATQIRQYVRQILCQRERLADDAYRLAESELLRGGQPCGVYYSLRGPRAMFLSAIWDARAGTILFYGSRGERFQRTKLHASAAPDADQPARRAA